MKGEFSQQMFEKCSNVKFHGNHSGGSRVVPHGQRDMTVLRVTLHNFTNTSKKYNHSQFYELLRCGHFHAKAARWKFLFVNFEYRLYIL